jgi:signal transduction histidine kinase
VLSPIETIAPAASAAQTAARFERVHGVLTERLRIARELHDAVAHSIATINVQAGAAEHVIAKHPDQAAAALQVIKQTSKQALAELREILGVLRRDEDDQRAPAAGLGQLEALLQSARRSGVQVQLLIMGKQAPLPTAVDLAAYRILQEALTNVARHAASGAADVTISYDGSSLTVIVSDQGGGSETFTEGAGHGIAGMRERARALGGTLDAGPRPGGGFEVRGSLPLQPVTGA